MEVNGTALLLAALLLLPSWAVWARLRNDGGSAGPASTPGGLPDLISASRKRRGKRKRGGKKAGRAADDVQDEEEEGGAEEEEVQGNGAAGGGDGTAASVSARGAEKEDGASTPDEAGSGSPSQRKKKGNGRANDRVRCDAQPGGAWKEPPPRQLSAASGVVTVTGRGSGRRKPQKAPSLAEFPALSAAAAPARNPTNAATKNTREYSGKGSSDDEDSSRPGPGGGIRHPNDAEVDDEDGAPVRVIKLTNGGKEVDDKVDLEERRREAAKGWIKVPEASSAPRTLRITSSSKSTSSPPLRTASSYGGGAQEETKKQRENRRRAERKKEEKGAERMLQEARLRAHRQEVMAARIKDLAKADAKRKLSAAPKSRSDSYNELLWD